MQIYIHTHMERTNIPTPHTVIEGKREHSSGSCDLRCLSGLRPRRSRRRQRRTTTTSWCGSRRGSKRALPTPPSSRSANSISRNKDLLTRVLNSDKMSTRILNESLPILPPTTKIASINSPPQLMSEIEPVECMCCTLVEECTPAYIARIRERHGGHWICGLCAEAVKDEVCRAGRLITMDEALNRHVAFCGRLQLNCVEDPAVQLIATLRQLMRRSLDSPRMRSMPSSPRRRGDEEEARQVALSRSGSCFPSIGG